MGNRAWIRLVENSTQTEISLQDVKDQLERYIDMASRTGNQLDWTYAEAAFPYTMEEQSKNEKSWLVLKGKEPKMYRGLIIGVEQEPADKGGRYTIQILIPPGATHGDKAKANEFCRYLAKQFQGELHLFNGRVMYFYPRK
ncbi:MAG: DUF1885 family protein [Planifilum sp.]|jgi:hypothetical protein